MASINIFVNFVLLVNSCSLFMSIFKVFDCFLLLFRFDGFLRFFVHRRRRRRRRRGRRRPNELYNIKSYASNAERLLRLLRRLRCQRIVSAYVSIFSEDKLPTSYRTTGAAAAVVMRSIHWKPKKAFVAYIFGNLVDFCFTFFCFAYFFM